MASKKNAVAKTRVLEETVVSLGTSVTQSLNNFKTSVQRGFNSVEADMQQVQIAFQRQNERISKAENETTRSQSRLAALEVGKQVELELAYKRGFLDGYKAK